MIILCYFEVLLHLICRLKWSSFVVFLQKNYENYDGFVILHGTDTMAYTASALSFMCEHLGKPVILTGSQVTAAIFIGLADKMPSWHLEYLLASKDKIRPVCRCRSTRWGTMAGTTCWGRCWLPASLWFLRWMNGDDTCKAAQLHVIGVDFTLLILKWGYNEL